ncbi:hypothetical protein BH23ACT5_BH23ACT5_01300 [soil metagenome]
MGLLIASAEGIHEVGGGHHLAGQHVNHVARSGDEWWAVDDDGVWERPTRVSTAPAGTGFSCVQPAPDGAWIGADSARLFRFQDGELTEDEFFAEAPGRAAWHTPWGGPPGVRSLSFGPDGVLYINVHVGGILRYDNTGLAATVDIDADVHQVAAHPDIGGTVVAATAWGLAQSSNGHDFEFRTDGLATTYCRAVTVFDDTILLSSSDGPRGGRSRLYRAALGGGPFQVCEIGLPDVFDGNLDTHCLAASSDGLFAANAGTVWRSWDQGESWEVVASDLPQVTALA